MEVAALVSVGRTNQQVDSAQLRIFGYSAKLRRLLITAIRSARCVSKKK